MITMKKLIWMTLLMLTTFLATMSCYLRPLINPPDNEVDIIATHQANLTSTARQIVRDATATSEPWTIEQCNAIQDVTIGLSEFTESDSGGGDISCAYTYTFINDTNRPIRIINYDRYYPSELYSLPSEWKSHTVIQPGSLAGIRSNIFKYTS